MSKSAPTLARLLDDLAAGRSSASSLVAESWARIGDPKGEGGRVLIRRFLDSSFAAAAASDSQRAAGLPMGPLAGLPLTVKDLFDVAGTVTTAGSVALRDAPPATADAPVVARLRAAGAVILGTTNMTEFAMGGTGINPHYGTPRNPWGRGEGPTAGPTAGRIPGGSSSGAAVSVTDGMAAAAIGSDTAGSVQMPAALCGLTGFKPTARRVPLEGSIPLATSADSIGPLAHSVACCALLDSVLAGEASAPVEPVDPRRLRIGVPITVVQDELEPAVALAFARALDRLSAAGVTLVELPMPVFAEVPLAQARAILSVVEGYAWHRELLQTKRALYDPIVAARFEAGAGVSAADYIQVLRDRAVLIRRATEATRGLDALALPTVPIIAPPIEDLAGKEGPWLVANRKLIRNPGLANFLDRCAISLPCHDPDEPPVGLSLMGETLGDRRLLAIAAAVERVLLPFRG